MIFNYIILNFLNNHYFFSIESVVFCVIFVLVFFFFLLLGVRLGFAHLLYLKLGCSFTLFFILSFFLLFSNNIVQNFVVLSSSWDINNILSFFFVDKLSILFCVMSVFVILLCYVYVGRSLSLSVKPAITLVTFTEILVLLCFTVRNLISFYIFFELILFPMTILILIYGSRGRRIFAAFSFFVYTFFGSIFILIGIFALYFSLGTLQFDTFLSLESSILQQNSIHLLFIFVFFWIGFSVKLPTMPVHLWLPEAHVEAPTIGSVILASILLKLGGFGILRVIIPLSQTVALSVRIVPIIFCVLSVFYASFLAYRHFDLKKIIAYSSIVHMNFAALAFLTESKIALVGCIVSMLCHSVVSSALFFTAGFLYEKLKTRNLLYYSSLFNQSNYVYVLIFLFVMANMAIPFTISFIGESLIYCGLLISHFNLFIIMIFSLFFSGLFSFMLVYRLVYFNRPLNNKIVSFTLKHNIYVSPFSTNNLLSFTTSEVTILSTLGFLILFLFFNIDIFIIESSSFVFIL